MNRRKLFSGLGLGAIATLFGTRKTKADSLLAANHDDIWVIKSCSARVNIDGKVALHPQFPGWRFDEGENQRLTKEYNREVSVWKDLPRCGAMYKKVRGTLVSCPKCEGNQGGLFEADVAILVEK
jgi:hypothetical protein